MTRILGALSAFIVLAVAISACGGDSVPGDAVATVDGKSIKKSDFNHLIGVSLKAQEYQAKQQGQPATPLDSPSFAKCVAASRKALPTPPKGQTPPSDAQLKASCKSQYARVHDQILGALIQIKWLEGEASSRGIKADEAAIKKQFAQLRSQQFPKPGDYKKFLTATGANENDFLISARFSQLQQKITQDLAKGSKTVTAAQIKTYYDKNKAKPPVTQPAKRNLLVVVAKTKGRAEQALAALRSGQSFKSVAKKYSIDPSAAQGGLLNGVTKGSQEPALDKAAFAAKLNSLQGPIKTFAGWYVFKATSAEAAKTLTLAQATPAIRQILISQATQKKQQAFAKTFQKEWTSKTNCAKGFIITGCKNAPKAKPASTGGTSGATTPAPQTQTPTQP